MLGIGADPMVLLDDRIEDIGEVFVGVPISSVDSAVLVVELYCTRDRLGKSEARGCGCVFM